MCEREVSLKEDTLLKLNYWKERNPNVILVTSDTSHRTQWNHSALTTTATNQNLLQRTNLNTKFIYFRKKKKKRVGLHHSDAINSKQQQTQQRLIS